MIYMMPLSVFVERDISTLNSKSDWNTRQILQRLMLYALLCLPTTMWKHQVLICCHCWFVCILN